MTEIKGGDKLEAALKALSAKVTKAASVQVGFLEGATYPDGKSVAQVASIQEWGAPSKGIPPRPFFRNMIAAKSPEWGEQLAAVLKETDYDATLALGKMGDLIAGELRESIIDTNDPPLSPVTLLLRQRFGNNPGDITFKDVQQAREDIAKGTKPDVTGTQAKPLVWTGQMLSSVDSKVT